MTGVVVDSGDGVTHIIPVWEGFSIPHLTKRINLAGRNITEYLIKLLQHRGYSFNRSADFETVMSAPILCRTIVIGRHVDDTGKCDCTQILNDCVLVLILAYLCKIVYDSSILRTHRRLCASSKSCVSIHSRCDK